MNVQIRHDKQRIRAGDDELDMEQAVQLVRDLIDAVTQCGHKVNMEVEVPRYVPPLEKINQAIIRIGHLRRDLDQSTPWHDKHTNTTFVMRVLEICL